MSNAWWAVMLALVVLAGWVRGDELIANGGFEQLSEADLLTSLPPETQALFGGAKACPFEGWLFGGGWEDGRYTVHVSDQAHSGQHACEIRCVKQGRGGIASRPFKLRPGTILEVSFWLKARDAEGGRIFLNYEGTPGDGWDKLDLPGGTYDWTKVSKRCVVPVRHERADGQTLAIFIYSKARGSIWIDDLSVRTVDVNRVAEAPDRPALMPPAPQEITEPADSVGYRVDVATALEKVLPDTDYPPAVQPAAAISLARNEREAFQVVVEAPWRDVTVERIELSSLHGPDGAVIPANALSWRRVNFVETTFTPP